MDETQLSIDFDEETGVVKLVEEKTEDQEIKQPTLDLSNLDLFEETPEELKMTPYTTELLENIQRIDPTLTTEQVKELIDYIKGSNRPDFMESMMTQPNDKLNDTVKLMVILQMLRIPALLDYQATLQKNLTSPEALGNLSYDEISKISANVQKEISDTLSLGLRTASSLSKQNTVPTKVEKLANALMGVSDSTRARIEEIIRYEDE